FAISVSPLCSIIPPTSVLCPLSLHDALPISIDHKTLTAGFVAILIKGIFANFFINISLVIAMQIDDVLAKMFVNMFGVSIFAFIDRKSTRLNSSHVSISYAVFCLKKKKHYQY